MLINRDYYEITDDEVIDAIKSVPTHYSDITFRNFSQGDAHNVNSIDPGLPSGTASTDILIAVFSQGQGGGGGGTLNTPTGWTPIHSQQKVVDGSNNSVTTRTYWALGSVGTTNFTSTSTLDTGIVILAFQNVDNNNPIDVTGTANNTTASSTITANAVTTVTDRALEIIGIAGWVGGIYSKSGGTNSASFTFKQNGATPPATNEDASCAYSQSVTTPAGSTGTVTISTTGGSTGQILVAMPFALKPATVVTTPLFMEPGSSATGDFKFFTSTTTSSGGAVTSQTSVPGYRNPRSIKCDSGASAGTAFFTLNPSAFGLTGRISFWFQFNSAAVGFITGRLVFTSGITVLFGINGSNKFEIDAGGAGSAILTDNTVLSSSTWYRACIAWNVTNSTTYTVNLYIESGGTVSSNTISNSTALTGSGTNDFGFTSAGITSGNIYFDAIYVDNDSTLTDLGAGFYVTAKKPAANNTNNFDTNIGANPANRWTNVNEVPLSETNGWRHNASTNVQENYTLETASQGDVNISGATIVARCAWLWGKKAISSNITRQQAVSANSSSVSISTPSSNDLILVFSYNNASTTIPTLATGYTNIATNTTTLSACRIARKLSAGNETTSGTWTNATNVVCMVFRGVNTSTPIGGNSPQAGNGATLTYGSPTMSVSDGTSWVAGFAGAKAATAGMGGNITGMTNETSQTIVNGLDTEAGVASFSSATLGVTGSGRWLTMTVEIESSVNTSTPKIMDNGTETAITLTTTSSLFTVLSATSTYPSNAAGIGIRSNNSAEDTFLYECGTIIAYKFAPVGKVYNINQAVNRASYF